MLLRKRAIIAASLTLIIFSSSISVLMGIGEAPKSFLGSEDIYVITNRATSSVINSRLDISLADQLIELGIAENSSPEIFAFAEINERAVVIRGVNFTRFFNIESWAILEGDQPDDRDFSGALIGTRLANRLEIGIGDRIPLVGSFSPSIAEVEIKGIIESGLGIDDELIISLPVAQALSKTPSSQVSIIRVRGDTEILESVFAAGTAKFSIYDLRFERSKISVNATMEITFWIKNWGEVEGSAEVTIIDELTSETIIEEEYTLLSGERKEILVNYSSEVIGEHVVTVHLGGPLTQNISGNVSVRPPFLTVIASDQIAQYHNFSVLVLDDLFQSIEGALVSIDNISNLTDQNGIADLIADLPLGSYNLTANHPEFDTGNITVEVKDASLLPPVPVIEAYDLKLIPDIVRVDENCTVMIYVHNAGNSSGSATIPLLMNGNQFKSQPVYLNPLEATVLYYNVSFSTAGERVFSTDSIAKILVIETSYQVNPGIVKLLLTYGDKGSIDPSRGALIYNTAKISEGNILIVLVSLSLLSGTLVTLGVSTIFMKEVNDNLRVIGILRSIGASSKQLLGIIFRESILLSLPAAAIGVAGGIALALLISASGRLIAFGHLIEPVLDPTFFIAAIVGSVIICVGSSIVAGLSVSRRKAIRMIRGLGEEHIEYPTIAELLRDEE